MITSKFGLQLLVGVTHKMETEKIINIIVYDTKDSGKFMTREILHIFPGLSVQGFNNIEDLHIYRTNFRVDLILIEDDNYKIAEELLQSNFLGKIILYGCRKDLVQVAKTLNIPCILQPITVDSLTKTIKGVLGINGDYCYITRGEFREITDNICSNMNTQIGNLSNKFEVFKDFVSGALANVSDRLNNLNDHIKIISNNGTNRDEELKEIREILKENYTKQDDMNKEKIKSDTDLKKEKIITWRNLIIASISIIGTITAGGFGIELFKYFTK